MLIHLLCGLGFWLWQGFEIVEVNYLSPVAAEYLCENVA